ncbi:MAG: DMT family transporter [Promethearchaeota archaeon]
MNRRESVGYSAVILAGLSFGAIPVISASMRDLGASSLEQSFLRLFVGLFIGLGVIITFYRRDSYDSSLNTSYFLHKTYSLQGLLLALMVVAYLSSIALKTPVGEAALFIQIHPFITLILASIFLEEEITRSKIIALLVALIGLLLLTSPWNWDSFLSSSFGDLLAATTGFLYSLYLLVSRYSAKERSQISPIQSIAWILCWSFLIGLPILFFLTFFPLPVEFVAFSSDTVLTTKIIVLGIFLALFGSIIPYSLILFSSKYIESSNASILLLNEPIGAIILAAILLNEEIRFSYILGGITLLAAIFLLLTSQDS